MRQLAITIITLFLLNSVSLIPVCSALNGRLEYQIPIDYSQMSENELNLKAEKFFYNALNTNDTNVNDDITQALMLYNILQKINPDKVIYYVKSGILYDKINLNKYAKSNFSMAIYTNPDIPESYYYFGEYYYKRQMYRKALKLYLVAYKLNMKPNYDLVYKLGDIYQKLGDTKNALKYLQIEYSQNPSEKLDAKIKLLETLNATNSEY